MSDQSLIKDYFKLHFVVLIWGFTAILGLLISIPSVELVFYRTLLAFIGLGILLKWRGRNFALGSREIIKMLLTGFLISAHWILFFASARVSTASVCLAGMATCSLWTSLLEPLIHKRSVRSYEVFLGLVVIFGLYVIFRFEFDHALGLSMAIASAMLSALFTVINGEFSKRNNPYMVTFYEMIGACIGTALFFPIHIALFAPNGLEMIPGYMDWFYILVLALVCTVYAYSVSVEIMKQLSPYTVNLTVNMEPVYGIVLAFLIFGDAERMNSGFYIGTLIILSSVLMYPVIKRFKRKKGMNPST